MKIKFKLLFLLTCFILSFPKNIFAVSGCCSSHGGVNCAAGPQANGKVICYDGLLGSSCFYSGMVMCQSYVTPSTPVPTIKSTIIPTPALTIKPTIAPIIVPTITPTQVPTPIIEPTDSPTPEFTEKPEVKGEKTEEPGTGSMDENQNEGSVGGALMVLFAVVSIPALVILKIRDKFRSKNKKKGDKVELWVATKYFSILQTKME